MRHDDPRAEAPHKTDNAKSVHALLQNQSERFADKDLLVVPDAVRRSWGLAKGSWTYLETLDRVKALAELYRRAGFGPGHRVALVLDNRPVHFFHWLALNAVGASIVPANPDYTADELGFVLGHSESRLVVSLASHLPKIAAVAAALGIPVASEDAAEMPEPAVPRAAGGAGDETAECALVYTSGTTGKPKGCMLSNDYFLGWAESYGAQGGMIALKEGKERLMTPLPAFHVNAIGHSFMGMLGFGGAQIIVDRFHPRSWWQTAIETEATCFHYLGVMPAILLDIAPSDLDRAHAMRFGLGGGVMPEHHARFEDRFGVPLLEGWAMTETGSAGLLCACADPRYVGQRCIGRPGAHMETRIVDDAGAEVAPGTPGELVLRAAGGDKRRRFFSGYLKNQAATDAVWADEWLHTGDIMKQGPDGSLYFVDRKKNIIRRSGENIAAIEIETAIASHAGVAKSAVVAVPDSLRGEEVLAAIVARDSGKAGADLAKSIFAHCADRLAYFKLPGYIIFRDALPVTSTQKIRKADLGAFTENPADHPDCFDFRDAKQRMRRAAS